MLLVITVGILSYLLYSFLSKSFEYWENKNVPFEKLSILPFRNLFRKRSLYESFPDKRYVGCYTSFSPTLLLRDPKLIKQIFVKEFDTFPDYHTIETKDVDPLWTKNLTVMKGDEWRDMKSTLSPLFTSSKLKIMFELMKDCAERFTDYFLKQRGTVEVEMQDAFSRFSLDVIGTTAFGVTCNSLENKDNEFYSFGQKINDSFKKARTFKILFFTIPTIMKMLRVRVFSKSVSTFFRGIIKNTIKERQEKGINRPDMIHLLLEAKMGRLKYEKSITAEDFAVVGEYTFNDSQKKRKPIITDEDITAQGLLFFTAGFHTVSILMTFTSYELAINPEMQNKLRKEVDETLEKYNGKLTYEGLLRMKYLDMVISETLRKWSPGIRTGRISSRPFTIEPKLPAETPVTLEVGSHVVIPIAELHKDPKYYPNPDKFDPERFNNENKHNIKPFTYLPFGAGPRGCIGSRFALLEGKLIIAQLISKFEIIPVTKTEIPIQTLETDAVKEIKNGMWLGLKPR